jgi:cytochrome c
MKIFLFLIGASVPLLAAAVVAQPVVAQPVAPKIAAPVTVAQNTVGARAFQQCRSCHTLKAGERNLVGPNLFQFAGKRVATANPTFRYSPAARASTLVWNDATLDQFLKSPSQTLPRTSMMVTGISNAATRAALIEFLKRESN